MATARKPNSLMFSVLNTELVDISVDPGEGGINITLDAKFNTTFGAVLGPNDVDEITILGEACDGNETFGFYCEGDALTARLEYEVSGSPQVRNINIPARSDATNAVDALQAGFGDTAVVSPQGTTLMVIRFAPEVGKVNLYVPKNCRNEETAEVFEDQLDCDSGLVAVPIKNSYGLADQEKTKTSFQIAVGDTSFSASLEVNGWVNIRCTVLKVIAVTARVDADLSGVLNVTVGDFGKMTRFTDWLGGLTAALNPEAEFYIGDHFITASATFDGSFTAEVSVDQPFNLGPVGASGGFVTPYVLNFLDLKGSGVPDIDMEVDIEGLGDLKFLSFDNIIDLLVDAMVFLIGDPADGHDLDSCSGGVLGTGLLGSKIFQYKSKFSSSRSPSLLILKSIEYSNSVVCSSSPARGCEHLQQYALLADDSQRR